jgi:hypothetical protein
VAGLIEFIEGDIPRTLFPLQSSRIVISNGEASLRKFIDTEIFVTSGYHPSFVQSPVGFALKDARHTRRVHILDPVATLFLYDFVYSNSALFAQTDPKSRRRRYGYHMKGKQPLSAAEEHQQFRQRATELRKQYRYSVKTDVSQCFPSFYHHHIVSFLSSVVADQSAQRFGTFLRQINGGQSVSCFPQGLFPTKAIGNLFLRFVEESAELSSPAIIRYLDDILIFSDSTEQLEKDFYRLQVMLSERNLYLNQSKTVLGDAKATVRFPRTNKIRISLLNKRAEAKENEYEDAPQVVNLTTDEFKYLSDLLRRSDVAEEDVELALALISEDAEHADTLATLVFQKYPHLIKNLYAYLGGANYNAEPLWRLINEVSVADTAHEFTLFWSVRILLDIYDWTNESAALLLKLYNHPNSTDVVKGAVLESEYLDHGLLSLKENVLKNSGSNLPAICAAVGLRQMERARRNQLYKYAASAGPLMYQITQALQKI